ncbi:BQ5605_C004g02772 [Microbotryum silenes-dioicae]|uniref:BQ5605_C004g02772 protein n=1 Tax=Microbotryum silenes-dioicae TaxID=796604 RepID=A0A2X0MVW0_9BASI|nr:BQ5605_C004g02772 [Microbotryum silenes-dioicae]
MALSSKREPVPTVQLDATDAAPRWPSQERHRLGDASSSPATLIADASAGTSADGARSMEKVVKNDRGTPSRPVNQPQHQRSRSWLAEWLKSGGATPSAIQAADENVPLPPSLGPRSSIIRTKSESGGRAIKTRSVLGFRRKTRRGSQSEQAVAPVALVPTPSPASDVPPRRPLPPTLTPDQDFVALRSPLNATPHHTLPAAALAANKRTTIAPSPATSAGFPTCQPSEIGRPASWNWDGGSGNAWPAPNRVSDPDAPSRDRIDSFSSVYSHDPVDLGEIWDDLVTEGEISLSHLIPTRSTNVFPTTPTSALATYDFHGEHNEHDVSTHGRTSHNLSSDNSEISFVSLSAFPAPPLASDAVFEYASTLQSASSLAERRGRKQAIPALIIPQSLVALAIDSASDDGCEFGGDGFPVGGPTMSYFSPVTPPCGATFAFDLSASTGSSRSSSQMAGLAISHAPSTDQSDVDEAASYEQERSTFSVSDVLARHLPVSKNAFLQPFQPPTLPRSSASSPTFGERSDSEQAPSSTLTAISTFSSNLWSGSESNASFETHASSVEDEDYLDPPPRCSSRRGGIDSSFDPSWSIASTEADGNSNLMLEGSSVDEQSMGDSFGRGKRWIEQEMKGVGMPGNDSTRTDETRVTIPEAMHVIHHDDEEDILESEDRTLRLTDAFGKKEVERRRVEAYDWGETRVVEPFMMASQRTNCEEELGTNEIVAWGVAL